MYKLDTVAGRAAAMPLARQAIKLDMKSRLCWHVVGIIARCDGDYPESVKNLKFACRLEDDNPALWRELAGVQALDEQYEGLLESRIKLMDLRPENEMNIQGVATAQFVVGNYKAAALMAEHCFANISLPAVTEAEEKGEVNWDRRAALYEMISFISHCYEKLGEYEFSFKFLMDNEQYFYNKTLFWETAARLCTYRKKHDDACKFYRLLLNRYGENQNYLFGYLVNALANSEFAQEFASAGLGPFATPDAPPVEQSPSVVLVAPAYHPYASLTKKWNNKTLFERFPNFAPRETPYISLGWKNLMAHEDGGRAWLLSFVNEKLSNNSQVRTFLLNFLDDLMQNEDLKKAHCISRTMLLFINKTSRFNLLEDFLITHLRKGVPAFALASMIQGFVAANGLKDETSKLLQLFVSRLSRPCSSFKETETEGEPEETADVLTSTLALSAAFEDFCGNHNAALQLIERAISLAPTYIDLYVLKGKIAKHNGQFRLAAQMQEEGRSMDLADKNLNTRATMYWLKCGESEIAREVVHLFPGEVGKTPNLHDTQVLWWELKMAKSLLFRIKNDLQNTSVKDTYGTLLGRALRHLTHSMNHFDDHIEKSLEFHPYVLRKGFTMTNVAFTDGVKRLKNHSSFIKPAVLLAETYLDLIEGLLIVPAAPTEPAPPAPNAKSTNTSTKKDKKKISADNSTANPEDDETSITAKVELDPSGELLLVRDAPESANSIFISRALQIASHLRNKCVQNIAAQVIAARVFCVAGKFVLALQAIQRIISITGTNAHHEVLPTLVYLLNSIYKSDVELNKVVLSVLAKTLEPILKSIGITLMFSKESALSIAEEIFSKSATIIPTRKSLENVCAIVMISAILKKQVPEEIFSSMPESHNMNGVEKTLDALKYRLKNDTSFNMFAKTAETAYPDADSVRIALGKELVCKPLDPSSNEATLF